MAALVAAAPGIENTARVDRETARLVILVKGTDRAGEEAAGFAILLDAPPTM